MMTTVITIIVIVIVITFIGNVILYTAHTPAVVLHPEANITEST